MNPQKQNQRISMFLAALLFLFVISLSENIIAQSQVEVILCEDVNTEAVYQGEITPVNPTTSFSTGTQDKHNVFVVCNFTPFGKSVGLRVVITKEKPDGRVEQDRVLSINSTSHNATTSFAIRQSGKYCIRVVDEFDESLLYSNEYYFTVN